MSTIPSGVAGAKRVSQLLAQLVPTERASWQDVIAGFSIAGLLLPEAVAYASIGNLPPQAGIIALFAGLICYGLFGASRFAIVSATSSSAAVLAAATAALANGDPGLRLSLGLALVLMTGLLFLLAGALQLGKLTDLIARPVMRGFSFGLAIVIIAKQFADMVGLHAPASQLIGLVPQLITQFSHWNWVGLAIGAATLVLLLGLGRFRRFPAPLIVIAIGIAANAWCGFTQYGVQLVGAIHFELAAPTLPMLSSAEWLRIGELGVAMALILYAESYSAIRSLAMQHGDHMMPNRDLIAFGVSNLVSGMFHGMPVGAGYSATMANEAAGARSRFAGWVAALAVLIIVLIFIPAIALVPQPVLAGIIVYVVGHMLNPTIFHAYFLWKRDRLLIVTSVLAVLLLGVLNGLLAAIAVSLLIMVRGLAKADLTILGRLGTGSDFVNMARHPEAQVPTGMLILRPEEPLFFANAERILSTARHTVRAAQPGVHSVILSLEESADLDSSSLEALQAFLAFTGGQGKRFYVARLKESAQQVLQQVFADSVSAHCLSELSVAEVVRLAQMQHATGTAQPAPKIDGLI